MFLFQFVYSLQVCVFLFQYVCVFVYVFLLSRFLYVTPISFSTLQRQNLPPGKPHSSLAFSSIVYSNGGVFPSDVEGMHELMDGFLVKSILIYLYPGCCVSLDRSQKLASTGNMLLVDVMDGSL